jgi:hypothetical protein
MLSHNPPVTQQQIPPDAHELWLLAPGYAEPLSDVGPLPYRTESERLELNRIASAVRDGLDLNWWNPAVMDAPALAAALDELYALRAGLRALGIDPARVRVEVRPFAPHEGSDNRDSTLAEDWLTPRCGTDPFDDDDDDPADDGTDAATPVIAPDGEFRWKRPR